MKIVSPANQKVEEASFVSYIIYASICPILHLGEILFTISANTIELVCNFLV